MRNGLATYNGLHPFEFMSNSDSTTLCKCKTPVPSKANPICRVCGKKIK